MARKLKQVSTIGDIEYLQYRPINPIEGLIGGKVIARKRKGR